MDELCKKSKIKRDREASGRFMRVEDVLRRQYKAGVKEGKEEGIKEGELQGLMDAIILILEQKNPVPDTLKEFLSKVNNPDHAKELLTLAASVASTEEFILKANL